MVSRVDIHMYSLASAIKDPSTSSMSRSNLQTSLEEAELYLGAQKGGSAVSHLDCVNESLTDKCAIANKLVDHFTPYLLPVQPFVPSFESSSISTNFHFSELREEDVLRKLTFWTQARQRVQTESQLGFFVWLIAPSLSCSLTKPL